MYEMTQFIVLSITIYTKVKSLVKLFKEEFMLSFGIVAVLAVDTESLLRGASEEICRFF